MNIDTLIQLTIAVIMILTFLVATAGSALTMLWMLWNAQQKINRCYKELIPNDGSSMNDRLGDVERIQGENTLSVNDLQRKTNRQMPMLESIMAHLKIPILPPEGQP